MENNINITNSLIEGFLDIRETGLYNMFDATGVVAELLNNGIYDAMWICENGHIDCFRYKQLLDAVNDYIELNKS